jgi:hypothetical protein
MSDSSINIQEDRWHVKRFVNNYNPPNVPGPEKDIRLPISQREWAWIQKKGLEKQQRLVDSAINGYPIPTIIMNRRGPLIFDVYDGRHRIETLWKYVNGEFSWKGNKYADLSDDQKKTLLNREIPVTIIDDASDDQLADIFHRLNAGMPLKDYDLVWSNRNTAIVKCVIKLIHNNQRLATALGMPMSEVNERRGLSNWLALVGGLATKNAGNMTSSFIRITTEVGLNPTDGINEEYVVSGIDAFIELCNTANTRFPAANKDKKKLRRAGSFAAFFFHDWMTYEDKPTAISKWVDIIGRMRGANSSGILAALTTTGANNLNNAKVSVVIKQVNDYIQRNIVPDNTSVPDESDEE